MLLLQEFLLVDLQTQMRTSDPDLGNIIKKCREDLNTNAMLVVETILQKTQQVIKYPSPSNVTLLVSDNARRCQYNFFLASKFASIQGLPMICWKKPACDALATNLEPLYQNKLIVDVFVKGAPAQILENMNVL